MTPASTRPSPTWIRLAGATLVVALAASSCSNDGDSALDHAINRLESGQEDPTGGTTDPGPDTDPALIPDPEPDPTPLPVDTEVRVGTLDNGLTYYLRSNDSPGSNLELRLVVDAGSLQEPEPGRGIAHFLEHMLFNGTESYPGNELDTVLRGLGTEIGPDLNAFTTYDETVYLLEVRATDAEAVGTAFDVLAEWAGAATIDDQAVVEERGVVRDELRQRVETGTGYVLGEFDRLYTRDTPYAGFDPIGEASSIEAMEAGDLRAFYDSWYRPDNMAVVAVGDLSLADLETQVIEHFDSLEARGPVPDRTDPGTVLPSEPATLVLTHPDESTRYISLDLPISVWDQSTVGGERLVVMEELIAEMVRNRLADAHDRGDLPQDTSPTIASFDWARELRFLGTNFQAGDLTGALTGFMSVLRTIETAGFTEDDVVRAIDTVRARYEVMLAGAGTTQDSDYATLYTRHFLAGADIGPVEATVERATAVLDRLSTEELTRHFRWLMQQSAPLVVAVGPDEGSLPTEADLEAALAAAAPSDQVDVVTSIDQLMAAPEPVQPVAVDPIPEVGGIEWVFDNGVRVVFTESRIAEGAVDLLASADGGWSLLEPGDAALAPLATAAVSGSGLAEHDRVTLNRFLAGSTAWFEPYIDQVEEGFRGGSSPDDLATLFQLLHLSVTRPRVDEVALTESINSGENLLAAAATDPSLQAWLALQDARFGSDPWQVIVPTREQLDGFGAAEALALYEERLGDVDDLVVAVVGDVDRDVVEELAQRYVGTLPAGTPDSFADVTPPPPVGVETRQVTLDDDVTAAGVLVHHEVEMDVDPVVETTALVLENIIRSRLFLSIREDLGASYGGSVLLTPNIRPDENVESIIDASSDPEQVDLVLDTILATLDDLARVGPTDEELTQAVAVVGSDLGFTTNLDVLDLLIRQAAGSGDEVPWRPVMLAALRELTAADVRALAAILYPGDRRIEVIRTLG